MRRKLIFTLFFILLSSECYCFGRYKGVKKFDHHFNKYSKRYFGNNFDWRFFKAQAVAESRLVSDAKSQVGAIGVMQIMPRTFDEIRARNKTIKGSRLHPKWNISAGIYYDRQIWKLFKAERPFQDRLDFMFGSYNAGKGNIIKAQKRAKNLGLNENRWPSIQKTLQEITGNHSRETLDYVEKIKLIKEKLK